MAKLESDASDAAYVSVARQHIENLERALQSDLDLPREAAAKAAATK